MFLSTKLQIDQLEYFDKEKEILLQHIKRNDLAQREFDAVRWEVHTKQDEIVQLQTALSNAHLQLFEERANVLSLTAERDQLKCKYRLMVSNVSMPNTVHSAGVG
jgi:hypothetical protein